LSIAGGASALVVRKLASPGVKGWLPRPKRRVWVAMFAGSGLMRSVPGR